MREVLEEILEKLKEISVDLLDEAFGVLGVNVKSVEPAVRADRVYYLQSTAYRRGFMAGLFAGVILISAVFTIARNANSHQRASTLTQPTERSRSAYAFQDN